MKNLLAPLLLLICLFSKAQYNPSASTYLTPLNKPIGLTGKSDGGRTMYYDAVNFRYRAFVSVAEANTYITGSARIGWFPVVINTGGTLLNGVITGGTNALYYWKDGIADGDLVLMNSGGGGSGTVTSVSGLSPLFTTATPTTTPAFSLSSQAAYTLLGRGSGTGVPSFLSSIDSNWVPFLHSEAYYNTKYQGKLTLTTTGSSGAATLVGNTLNIPQYSGGGGGTNIKTPTNNFKMAIGADTVKSVAPSYGISIDSLTAKTVTFKFDSAGVNYLSTSTKTGVGSNRTYYNSNWQSGDQFGQPGGVLFGNFTSGAGIAVGYHAEAFSKESIALGMFSRADSLATIAIGDGAKAISHVWGGNANIPRGIYGNQVVIGDAAYANGNVNFFLGGGAGIDSNFVMCLGCAGSHTDYNNRVETDNHQAFLGWYEGGSSNAYFNDGSGLYNDWWIGGPVNAFNPHNLSINVTNSFGGSDFNGVNMTFNGSKGQGAGNPGRFIFKTADKTASGTTVQTLSDKFIIGDSVYHPKLIGPGGLIGITTTGAEYLTNASGTATPTLQSVTDSGNTTTQNIAIGAVASGNNALQITRLDSTGLSKAIIAIHNSSPALPTGFSGSLYNYSGINLYSGNDAKLSSIVNNYGSNNFFGESGLYITNRNDDPIVLRTGAASNDERMRVSALGVTINAGSNAFTLPSGKGSNTYMLTSDGAGGTNWTAPSGLISGLTNTKYPIATGSTTIADGTLTESAGAMSTTSTFQASKIGVGAANTGTNAYYAAISNNDGGGTLAPIMQLKNTNATPASGADYNIAGASFIAENGGVLAQFVANSGIGATAPFNIGSSFLITTRTDHPIVFATGASTSERFRLENSGPKFTLGSDATGDMWYRNSSGYFTRLGIGSSGQVLTVAAGLPSWATATGGSGVSYAALDSALNTLDSVTVKTTTTSNTTPVFLDTLTVPSGSQYVFNIYIQFSTSPDGGKIHREITVSNVGGTYVIDVDQLGTDVGHGAVSGLQSTITFPQASAGAVPRVQIIGTSGSVKWTLSRTKTAHTL